ncbi:MAG: uroporphyrinogen-III synthase [Holosporaceae bacterium]
MQTLVIPRALNEAKDTAHFFEDVAVAVKAIALFDVLFKPPKTPVPKSAAVCVTSKNGVRALARFGVPKDSLLFVVGQASYDLAETLGYQNCLVSSDGTAKGLVDLVVQKAQARPLFYLRGQEVRYPLKATLSKRGLSLCEHCVYKVILRPQGVKQLHQALLSKPWGVVVLSLRIAQVLKDVITTNRLQPFLNETHFFALSAESGAPLFGKTGASLVYPATPSLLHLKKSVQKALW